MVYALKSLPDDDGGPAGRTRGAGNRAHVYGFEAGDYDRSRTLVIDPAVLVYCGFIGGGQGKGIAVDGSGNAYVTGATGFSEASFPVNVGPDLSFNGNGDVFVAKVRVDPPSLTSITPSSASACDPAFTLTATGSGFIDGADVLWDGQARPTTFVSGSRLDASIATADLSAGSRVGPIARKGTYYSFRPYYSLYPGCSEEVSMKIITAAAALAALIVWALPLEVRKLYATFADEEPECQKK